MLDVAKRPPSVPPLPDCEPRLVLTIPDCADPRTTVPSGVTSPGVPPEAAVAAVADPLLTLVTEPAPSLDVVLGEVLEFVGDGLVPVVVSGEGLAPEVASGEGDCRSLRLCCLLGVSLRSG